MRISDWSSDVCASDLILEGEGRERLGTVLGDQHLLLQLHALAAILLADVALDADRHAGLEDAVVAGGVEVLQVDHRRILVAEPDAVHHHRIAVGPAACRQSPGALGQLRSEEHTSELQSLMRISYAVFCLKKKKNTRTTRECTFELTTATTT